MSGATSSLRTRWNRAFAGLSVVLLVCCALSIAGTEILIQSYESSARRLEAESSLLAELRADIVSYAVVTATPSLAGMADGRQAQLEQSIPAEFDRATNGLRTPAERQLLVRGYAQWVGLVQLVRTLTLATPVTQRPVVVGNAVNAQGPTVLASLDRAGAASRASARSDVVRNNDAERITIAGWVVAFLLAIAMMVRLARRLSSAVLQPVSELRSSANQLAAGDLTHRVRVGRDDELGDLARSFNAMADAVAGTQRTLTRQANHDSLTGLANRASFQTRVREALARPDRRGGTQALLFVDLDDFKDVNDQLGHAAGDDLLRTVATRLRAVIRPGDLVARLGGDEFAVLLDGIPDTAAAYRLAGRAVESLGVPVEIAGTVVHIGASIGLSMRGDGSDVDGLMREADVAMYSAKGLGKNRVECYDVALHNAVVEHQSLRADIDLAAARDELVLDYQPIVDLNSGELKGVEALVRWQHPTRGLLPPSAFIQVAEDSGAIVEIGSWVLRSATQQVQSWQRRYGRPDLCLSVNVSVRQLEAPAFADLVIGVLATVGLDPGCLIVEVTESVLADPSGGAAAALADLRAIGVRVALDDFGTGYSSIGYLRQLPVDILKIDRSFVTGHQVSSPGQALLEAIVALGQRLGLDVIPEGIELPADLTRLRAIGCSSGQGFLLSRPVAPGEIDQLLAAPLPVSASEALWFDPEVRGPAPTTVGPCA